MTSRVVRHPTNFPTVHIFIDESGQFIPLSGARSRAAAVVGLVIPSSSEGALRRAFRKLKRRLGAGGRELKGSSLTEAETAEVIALLQGYDVIVEAVVLDAGQHDDAKVSRLKAMQADRLFDHITRDHQPSLIQELFGHQASLKGLSNQLFLQVICIWQLIDRMVETATMYYAQRRPAELASFVWRVDAKDKAETTMERLWTTLIGPALTARSVGRPMAMMAGADYSYFSRYDAEPPEGIVRQPNRSFTDLGKLFHENFAFASSESDLGLQLSDIVASTLTRALNGTLQPAGWESLGSLFVHRREQTVHLVALASEGEPRKAADDSWAPVVHRIEALARPMIAEG